MAVLKRGRVKRKPRGNPRRRLGEFKGVASNALPGGFQTSAEFPIKHWSHSSLMAYLRNPLAWYKRYVEKIYDQPSNPSSIIGRAGHTALQNYYGGIAKDGSIEIGLDYLRKVPDFEINFGKAFSGRAKKEKRASMEKDYLQAINFYLAKPPKWDVLGIEESLIARIEGLPLPIKAVSDLVVRSKVDKKAVDIVDHKFVDAFSKDKGDKTLFVMQALFNYYTVKQKYGKEVRRFIVQECRKKQNRDGSPQMRRYIIDYSRHGHTFTVFHRLLSDATSDMLTRKVFLPNPSDMFEGENSFEIYRLGLTS